MELSQVKEVPMKKVLIVCTNGLGSSFIVEMNIKKILSSMGVTAEVSHTDLSSAKSEKADFYVGAVDVVSNLDDGSRQVYGLQNMLDNAELERVLSQMFKE